MSIEIKTSKCETTIDKLKAIVLIQLKGIKKYENILTIVMSQVWGNEPRNVLCKEKVIEYYYTEITTQNVDKWNAITYLMEKLGIQKEEVITIGDNMNDKTMIQEAGLGVVMGGSTPMVTEIADYVTSSNDEEGVAKALEKFC